MTMTIMSMVCMVSILDMSDSVADCIVWACSAVAGVGAAGGAAVTAIAVEA